MKPAMGIFDKCWLYFKFDGCFSRRGNGKYCFNGMIRDVAQPGSAPRSGRGGRWFESSHPDQCF